MDIKVFTDSSGLKTYDISKTPQEGFSVPQLAKIYNLILLADIYWKLDHIFFRLLILYSVVLFWA